MESAGENLRFCEAPNIRLQHCRRLWVLLPELLASACRSYLERRQRRTAADLCSAESAKLRSGDRAPFAVCHLQPRFNAD
jgi:hypothetical protein